MKLQAWIKELLSEKRNEGYSLLRLTLCHWVNFWHFRESRSRHLQRQAMQHNEGTVICNHSYSACKVYMPYYSVICGLSGYTIFSHIISQTVQFSGKKLLNIKRMFRFSLQFPSKTFPILKRIQWDTTINVHMPSCKVSIILDKIEQNLNFLNRHKKYSTIKFHENASSGSPVVPWRIQWDTTINVHMPSCKVSIILDKIERNLNFLNRFMKNTRLSNFMKIHPVGAQLFHADGQTDVMKLIVALHNPVKYLKMGGSLTDWTPVTVITTVFTGTTSTSNSAVFPSSTLTESLN